MLTWTECKKSFFWSLEFALRCYEPRRVEIVGIGPVLWIEVNMTVRNNHRDSLVVNRPFLLLFLIACGLKWYEFTDFIHNSLVVITNITIILPGSWMKWKFIITIIFYSVNLSLWNQMFLECNKNIGFDRISVCFHNSGGNFLKNILNIFCYICNFLRYFILEHNL